MLETYRGREGRGRESGRNARAGGAAGGFTILEIMIATAILTLGLVSVLALFPVAIHTGKKVVDTSTAAVIAESVAEAIREGMRNQARAVVGRNKNVDRYFVFKHDGVKDIIPNDRKLERADKDYYILLPRFEDGKAGEFSGAGEEARRTNAMLLAKTFVYPESDPAPNGGGNASIADDDGDDFVGVLSDGRAYKDFKVDKTYPLGVFLPDDNASGVTVFDDQKIESLKQYSYAFAIRSSKYDANGSFSPQQYKPENRLYNVRVLVFRGFTPPPAGQQAKHQEPVFEFEFEVAL